MHARESCAARWTATLRTIGALLLAAAPLAAQEPPREPAERALFVPGTLHGWDEAAERAGWSATADGVRAEAGATPLRSAFAFDAHELRARVALASGGALRLRWLRADGAEAFALRIAEAELAWIAGATVIARAELRAMPREELRIEVRDGALTVSCGEARCRAERPDLAGRHQLGLAGEGTGGAIEALRVREPEGERLSAAQLSRWTCDGERAAWTTGEGELRLAPGNGRYLMSDALHANFALSFRYRMPRGANSGVALRTPRGGWPSTDGIELQLLHAPANAPLDEHMCGALYGNLAPLARALHLDDWNEVHVVLDGAHLCAWWNGTLVQSDDLAAHPELRDRPARGWIGFQDHGATLEVRELRLRALPEPSALARSQRPLSCAQRALLGAIEPGWLARALDGAALDAAPIATRFPSGGEARDTVLAELTGPGVLLRIEGLAEDQRVRLRRDGAERPLFEGRADALAKHVDAWSATGALHFLAVPFARSLRVEALGAAPPFGVALWHLPARDASERELASARGFVEVARYRRIQHEDGRLRRLAPLEMKRASARALPSGSKLRLELPGSGEVVWLGIDPGARASAGELWLRATSDGRGAPELELPLRHLFPARAAGQLAQSWFELGGERATLRCALPFARGLVLELENRGAQPESGLALHAAVRVAASADEVPRARLHGRFRPHDAEGPLALEGAGFALRTTARAEDIGLAIGGLQLLHDGASVSLLELIGEGLSSRELFWQESLPWPPRFAQARTLRAPRGVELGLLGYVVPADGAAAPGGTSR